MLQSFYYVNPFTVCTCNCDNRGFTHNVVHTQRNIFSWEWEWNKFILSSNYIMAEVDMNQVTYFGVFGKKYLFCDGN